MRFPLFSAPAWARFIFLLSILASVGVADVSFTEPSAGANLHAGEIDVKWEDSGVSPPISELTQYTLSLMVGGNDDNDMQPVSTFESQGSFSSGNSAKGTIPEGIAADVPNGFFFRMTSTKEEGGVLINYSNRFSISGLSGDTALKIRQGAQALDGNTDGPPAVGNDASSSTNSATSTSSSAASTSSESSSASTMTSPATTSSTSESFPNSSSTSTALPEANESSSLSKGTTAGIAVSITLAAVAICAAIATYMYLRRRKKQNEVQEIAPGNPFHPPQLSELSSEELIMPKTAWAYRTELSSDSMVYEAGSRERLSELDHTAFRAELEGSPVTPNKKG